MTLSRALHRDHERIFNRGKSEAAHFHYARDATLALKREEKISELEASIALAIHRQACRAKHGHTAAPCGDSNNLNKTATASGDYPSESTAAKSGVRKPWC